MHPRRKPTRAEPARLHPRRQPDDPGGVAAVAARDGRRGRRGLSELGAGRPAGRDALGPGGGRRARRRRPAAREPVAGQPPARAGRRPRARAAPLGAAGLGARRPGPHRCARGAGARAAGRHPGAGARARGGRPGCRSLRRPGPAHHATSLGRPSSGVRRSGRSPRRWPRSTPSTPPASRPTGATTSPTAWPCRPGPPTAACGSARSPWPTRRRPSCPNASSTATSIRATRCGRAPSSPAWSTGPPARAGPAAVDLGHLRWNLALDYGQRVADALLPHPEHDPYYDVVTALDVLPELDTTFTHAELLRLEEHVARALRAR